MQFAASLIFSLMNSAANTNLDVVIRTLSAGRTAIHHASGIRIAPSMRFGCVATVLHPNGSRMECASVPSAIATARSWGAI